jgi:hypothetical protein
MPHDCGGWAAIRTSMGNRLLKIALRKKLTRCVQADCSLAYQLRRIQEGHVLRFLDSTYQSFRRIPMRNFIVICIVALLVAVGVSYAVGLIAVTADQPEGQYNITLTINTAMLHHANSADPSIAPSHEAPVKVDN